MTVSVYIPIYSDTTLALVVYSSVIYVIHGFNQGTQTSLVQLAGYLGARNTLCHRQLPVFLVFFFVTITSIRCLLQSRMEYDQSLAFLMGSVGI